MRQWMLVVLAAAAVSGACGGAQEAAPPEDASASAQPAATAPAPAPKAAAPPAPEYREVTLPAGTVLPLELATAVSSDGSRVEDAVRATLRRAVSVDGQAVLPPGTELAGTVTQAQRSGRVKGRARVSFRFDSLRHDGERYDIRTAVVARQAEATKSEDATKVAIGAGAGAAIGALMGGGSGAAKGAAIGAAGGTGVVLATRGDEVRLGPGADISTRLTAPLTLRVRVPASR